MASLPAQRVPLSRSETNLIEFSLNGLSLEEIANKVYPNSAKRRRALRRKMSQVVANNPDVQLALAEAGRANLISAIPAATEALARRATRGNPQAIKLLFEASGFHNPKVKHEHSGSVEVKLSMPRPPVIEDEPVDAEVVE